MDIDRKYQINAANPSNGRLHTEEDSVLFLAKDQAFLESLPTYLERSRALGSNQEHLDSIVLLTERVRVFQQTESKVPDTVGEEAERCLRDD